MAAWWKPLVFIFVALYVGLSLIGDADAEPRGGRFGGRYGGRYGSRYSSTRSRVRVRNNYGGGSSTRVRVRYRVRNGYGYGSPGWSWRTAATAGAIYGFHSYSMRRSYHSHPHRQPTICINERDYTMENGTQYSLFICPMVHQPDSYTYCCGSEGYQHCCSFGSSGARVFGVVVGVLFFVGIVALIIWCACCRSTGGRPSRWQSRHGKKQGGTKPYTMNTVPPPQPHLQPQPMAPAPYTEYNPTPTVPASAYPPAPQGEQYPLKPPTDPSYPGQPAYGGADPNQPGYPVNPGNAPYPPAPGGYPPVGAAPYPPAEGGYPPPVAAPPYPPAENGYPPPQQPPYPAGAPGGYPANPPPPYPQ